MRKLHPRGRASVSANGGDEPSDQTEFHMFRKSILALAAISALGTAALVPTTADANRGGRYGWYGKHQHYAPYRGFHGYRYSYGPRFFGYGPRYFHRGWKHRGWRYGGWR